MRLLSRVKVGALEYKVIIVEELNGARAQTDHSSQTITVKKMRDTMMQQTLFHEVVHCINNEIGEVEAEFLGNAFYQFYIDNLARLEALREGTNEDKTK